MYDYSRLGRRSWEILTLWPERIRGNRVREITSWVAWCGALPEAPPEGLMEEQIYASPKGLRTTQGTPL